MFSFSGKRGTEGGGGSVVHMVPGWEQALGTGAQLPLELFSCIDLSNGRPVYVPAWKIDNEVSFHF